jgi:hypothetical protein
MRKADFSLKQQNMASQFAFNFRKYKKPKSEKRKVIFFRVFVIYEVGYLKFHWSACGKFIADSTGVHVNEEVSIITPVSVP